MPDENNNTGHYNTGDLNTGNYNTGNLNTGNYNTGDLNTGRRNTGNYNTGHYSTGHRNTGDYNTGNYNTGDYNTGDRNTGRRNTGHYNTGNYNTGYRNTGDYNIGDYNTGDRNAGFFCTETPNAVFFDRPTDMSWEEAYERIPPVDLMIGVEWVSESEMTEYEKSQNPNYRTIGGFLRKHDIPIQEAFPKAWAKMDDETRQKFLDLPNFDAEKFRKCTGVDVRKPERKRVKIRLSGGEIVEGEIVE